MTTVSSPAPAATPAAVSPTYGPAPGHVDFRPGSFPLRDAWFPVVHSRLLGRRPVLRPIHGQPVYLWREHGALHASEDSPADRARGRFRAGELTGGTGYYPVAERYGYVWVWYGNVAAASPGLIPRIPHLPPEGGMPRHFLNDVVFDCAQQLICENLLDLTHADFLHSWSQMVAGSDIRVWSTSETVIMVRTANDRPVPKGQRRKLGTDRQNIRMSTLVYVRSGVCISHGAYEPGMAFWMMHPANPETSSRTRTPVTFDTQRVSPLARHLSPLAGHLIARQDNWAVRAQNALYLRPGGEPEMNYRFDTGVLRYRKTYQELVARQQRGDYTYLPDGDPGRDLTAELERL
jgi:phenylpropionate dioxygenase-like ring-hydroxylating dioxygenase large terminal subunit